MFCDDDGFSLFSCPFRLTFPVFLKAPHGYLNRIPLFFKPLSLWSRIFLSRNFSNHRSRLLLVVSVVLSRFLFSSLVWYVFLLLPLFTFSYSGFRGSLVPHFFGWNSVERILSMGSYCFDLRVIRACLAGILPLYHSFDLPYTCLVIRTSFGPNRSYGQSLGGRPAEGFESRQIGGGSGSLAVVVDRAPPADHPFPSCRKVCGHRGSQ